MKIFISYSSSDSKKQDVEEISTALTMAGYKVFFYEKDQKGGKDFRTRIKSEISSCEGCIFLIGKSFFKPGSYTLTELKYVKKKWSSPDGKILSVLLDKTIKCGDGYLTGVHHLVKQGNLAADICDEAEELWPLKSQPIEKDEPLIEIKNYTSNPSSVPYFALSNFGPNDWKYFSGRNNFVKNKLLKRIEDKKQFIVVLGASGAGKSSVVLAGLVPALHSEFVESDKKEHRWKFTYIRPNENNLYTELARALIPFCDSISQKGRKITINELISIFKEENSEIKAESIFQKILESHENNNFLIIADQFEELFRTRSGSSASKNSESLKVPQDHFLKILLSGIEAANSLGRENRFVLVVTIQETENAIKSGLFADKLGSCFETLGPIDPNDIEQIIKVPGVKIENRVVDDIKKKFVGTENKISLPLLQYFLWNLWVKNQESITFNAYKNSKKVEETLVDATNEAWDSLIGRGEKEADIKKLFLGLVNVSAQKKITLRERSRSELGEISWRIAEYLAKENRLIVIYKKNNCETAEIAHEVLLTNWLASTKWFKDYSENLQLIDRIEKRTKLWSEQRRSVLERLFGSRALLFRGDELDKAIEYSSKPDPLLQKLTNEAKVFVNTGRCHKWIVRFLLALFPASLFIIPVYIYIDNENKNIDTKNAKLQGKIDTQRAQEKEQARSRLSAGEKVFFETYFEKRHASWLFHEGDNENERNKEIKEKKYNKAYETFDNAIKQVEDDPEAWIYRNNAKIRKEGKDSLVIAVNVPIQKNPSIALEILRGVAQVQDVVNKQLKDCSSKDRDYELPCNSLLSKPLQVVIGSDDNDRGVASKMADYLVKDMKEVLAVIGHNASDVSNSAAKIYQGQLLMISPTSFALDHAEISKIKGKNYIYSMATGIDILVSKTIEIMSSEVEENKPHVLICYDSRAMDQALIVSGFKQEKNKDKISYSDIKCDFSLPSKSIDEILEDAKRENVTHLFLGPHVNTLEDGFYMVRKNQEKSTKKLKLYASPTLYTDITLKNGETVEGLVLGAYWHPNLQNKESISFHTEATAKKWNKDGITWRTALAYDATKLIVEGLKKIPNGKELTHKQFREKLRDEVIKLRESGVTGKIVFNERNGKREEQLIHLMRVLKDLQGTAGYEFKLIESKK